MGHALHRTGGLAPPRPSPSLDAPGSPSKPVEYSFNQSVIRLSHWNARSFTGARVTDLLLLMGLDRSDVVCVSEVWNPDDGTLTALSHAGLDFFLNRREPRLSAHGGTMLIWRASRFSGRDLSNELPPVYRTNKQYWQATGIEPTAVELTPRLGGNPTRIVSIYARPQPAAAYAVSVSDFKSNLRELWLAVKPDICAGDWNARSGLWEPVPRGGFTNTGSTDRAASLFELSDELDFDFSIPDELTMVSVQHANAGGAGSTVDFVLLNEASKLQVSAVTCRPSTSDHKFITHVIHMHDTPILAPAGTRKELFHAVAPVAWSTVTDSDRLRAAAVLLTRLGSRPPDSVDNRWRWILGAIHSAMDVLPRSRRVNSTNVPDSVRLAGEANEAAVKKWLDSCSTRLVGGDGDLAQAARDANAEYRSECQRFTRRMFEADATKASYEDTMAWKIYKKYTERGTASRDIKHGDATWTTDQQKADGFLSVYAEKHDRRPGARESFSPFSTSVPGVNGMPDVQQFTIDEVRTAINANKLSGCPDGGGIDTRMLRLLAEFGCIGNDSTFLRILADLFILSVRHGRLPRQWKDAIMVPVPKDGKPLEMATSWRPVAITSLVCRTFERCLQSRVRQYLVLSPEQYGFRPGTGTLEPVLEKLLAMLDAMERSTCSETTLPGGGGEKVKINAAFKCFLLGFDYTDAFCKVTAEQVAQQYILCLKSEDRDGPARAYSAVIKDFMSCRRMRVRIGDTFSEVREVLLGVPQGSVLGPLCWTLVMEVVIKRLRDALSQAVWGGNDASVADDPACSRDDRCLVGYSFAPNRGLKAENVNDLTSDKFVDLTAYADDSGNVLAGMRKEWLQVVAQRLATSFGMVSGELNLPISAKSQMTLFSARTASPSTGGDLSVEASPDGMGELRVVLPGDVTIKATRGPVRDLGVLLDSALTMSAEADRIMALMDKRLNCMRSVIHLMSPKTARSIYMGAVLSIALYCSEATYHLMYKYKQEQMERLHNKALRIISGVIPSTRLRDVQAVVDLPSLREMVFHRSAIAAEKLRCRPDSCPAKARFLHDGRRAARNPKSYGVYSSLRDAAPDVLVTRAPFPALKRLPIVAHLEKPLYRVEDTAAAANVEFLLHFKDVPRKADMIPATLLNLNLAREDSLPARHWRLLSDGGKSEVDGVARSGCASMLQLFDRGAGTIRTLWTRKSKISWCRASCSFSCECNAANDGLQASAMTLNYYGTEDVTMKTVETGEPTASLDPEALPLVMIVDALSYASMMAEHGASGQKNIFGARAWQYAMHHARFRRVIIMFVYSHCGFVVQDAVDIAAGEAVAQSRDQTAVLHDLWHVDVARIQQAAIRDERARSYASNHILKAGFYSHHCSGPKTIVSSLPARPASRLHWMQVGEDPGLGGWNRQLDGYEEVCPLPGCGCLIARGGRIEPLDAKSTAALQKQRETVLKVLEKELLLPGTGTFAAKRLAGVTDAIVQHPVSHLLCCPSPAAAAKRAVIFEDGVVYSTHDLFDESKREVIRALLKYRRWFEKARDRIMRGLTVEDVVDSGSDDDGGDDGRKLIRKALPKSSNKKPKPKQQPEVVSRPHPFLITTGPLVVVDVVPQKSKKPPPRQSTARKMGHLNGHGANALASDVDGVSSWPMPRFTAEAAVRLAKEMRDNLPALVKRNKEDAGRTMGVGTSGADVRRRSARRKAMGLTPIDTLSTAVIRAELGFKPYFTTAETPAAPSGPSAAPVVAPKRVAKGKRASRVAVKPAAKAKPAVKAAKPVASPARCRRTQDSDSSSSDSSEEEEEANKASDSGEETDSSSDSSRAATSSSSSDDSCGRRVRPKAAAKRGAKQ